MVPSVVLHMDLRLRPTGFDVTLEQRALAILLISPTGTVRRYPIQHLNSVVDIGVGESKKQIVWGPLVLRHKNASRVGLHTRIPHFFWRDTRDISNIRVGT